MLEARRLILDVVDGAFTPLASRGHSTHSHQSCRAVAAAVAAARACAA